jgi:hypothetical protein
MVSVCVSDDNQADVFHPDTTALQVRGNRGQVARGTGID